MSFNQLVRRAPVLPITGSESLRDPFRSGGKEGRAIIRSTIAEDCESLRTKREATATRKLLELLKQHHDFNLPNPPKKWLEKKELVAAAEFIPITPPSNPFWFRIEEDEQVRVPKVSEIQRAACKYFKLTPVEINAKRRLGKIVYARHIAFYLCKMLTTASLPQIGNQFGGRDHTTVLHGVRKMEKLVKSDWKVAFDVAAVEGTI